MHADKLAPTPKFVLPYVPICSGKAANSGRASGLLLKSRCLQGPQDGVSGMWWRITLDRDEVFCRLATLAEPGSTG